MFRFARTRNEWVMSRVFIPSALGGAFEESKSRVIITQKNRRLGYWALLNPSFVYFPFGFTNGVSCGHRRRSLKRCGQSATRRERLPQFYLCGSVPVRNYVLELTSPGAGVCSQRRRATDGETLSKYGTLEVVRLLSSTCCVNQNGQFPARGTPDGAARK
uniref:Uncharacterized protein n=1 Tax=Candidatus Kentrum sp. SD TaxID=2126332 RepID=A0A451BP17_9GAMM|nr:MAG: hypothetical protein BECKSD772D_GA0070982_107910 [Candidatus Kentron sp. SD]